MLWDWLLPWRAKKLLEAKDAQIASLDKTIQDLQTSHAFESEKLKIRLEDSQDRIKKHQRALATTAFWIRTTHRVDVPAADDTIRKLIMEAHQ